jgi:uncharacterized membrane-anchored protein
VNRGLAFLCAVAPQVLLVAALAAREELGLRQGVEVRLEGRPIDPMSLFAGRYVDVPLAIEVLSPDHTRIEPGLRPGDEVCVRLERSEPVWKAVEATRAPPREEGAVFLRGTWQEPNHVRYGIDTFYIPQDGADPSRRALLLVLRITRDGRGHIADLLVEGRPYMEWNAAHKGR